MTIRAFLARNRGRIAFLALAGAALLVSHDAIFLVQVGPGEALTRALRQAGHGHWAVASVALLLIGLAAALWIGIRMRRLRRRAERLGAGPIGVARRAYFARALAGWARLFALVVVGFAIQENLEHIASHQHVPGLGALIGPQYPLALPVIGLITLLAALVAAAVVSVEHGLVATIAAALRRLGRAPRRAVRAPQRLAGPAASPLARSHASRAPPHLVSVPT